MHDERGRARDAADRLRRVVESSTKGTRLEEQQRHLSELLAGIQNAELRHKISLAFEQQQKMLVELTQTAMALVLAQQHNLAEAKAAVGETLRARSLEVDDLETMDDLSDDSEFDDEPPRRAPFAHVPDATRVAARLAANAPVQEPSLPGPHVADAARKVAGKAKQRKSKNDSERDKHGPS
jgi:hypothetical protein